MKKDSLTRKNGFSDNDLLDAVLAKVLKPPRLSPGFHARLDAALVRAVTHEVACTGVLQRRGGTLATIISGWASALHSYLGPSKVAGKGPRCSVQDMLDLLRRRDGSKEDAEDLIQEAWTRLMEYPREGQEVQNEKAPVKSTAAHLSIDRHRYPQRYPIAEEEVAQLEQRLPLLHQSPTPDEVLTAEQRLRDKLNEFSNGTGDIYMAHRAGFSEKKIAAFYGISVSAITKCIARAVQWLMDQKDPI